MTPDCLRGAKMQQDEGVDFSAILQAQQANTSVASKCGINTTWKPQTVRMKSRQLACQQKSMLTIERGELTRATLQVCWISLIPMTKKLADTPAVWKGRIVGEH